MKEETLSEYWNDEHCSDCGAEEGELHHKYCDMATCSSCKIQRLQCTCPPDSNRHEHPFIFDPLICGRCSAVFPNLFMVPSDEWLYYIEPGMRNKIICLECYKHIRQVTDKGKYALDRKYEIRHI